MAYFATMCIGCITLTESCLSENQHVMGTKGTLARSLKQTLAQKHTPRGITMTRLSRFSAPRATIVAFVLLAVAIFGFRLLAEAGHDSELVATQEAPRERPALRGLSDFCWSG